MSKKWKTPTKVFAINFLGVTGMVLRFSTLVLFTIFSVFENCLKRISVFPKGNLTVFSKKNPPFFFLSFFPPFFSSFFPSFSSSLRAQFNVQTCGLASWFRCLASIIRAAWRPGFDFSFRKRAFLLLENVLLLLGNVFLTCFCFSKTCFCFSKTCF